jgi:hypothetical protein
MSVKISDKFLEIDLKNRSNKIFGIGLPKTGTSSLNKALEILGYRSIHHCNELKNANAYSIPISRWSHILSPSKWEALTNFGEHIYPLTDKEFPNSKFILTIRDKKPWLESMKNAFKRYPIIDKDGRSAQTALDIVRVVHTRGHASYNKEYLPIMYGNHLRNAKYYFEKREKDLLVIDICGGEGWEKLCPFLGKDVIDVPFPYENKTLDIRQD